MMELIDHIFSMTGLQYISDMHGCENWGELLHAVRKIPKADYSNDEWNEAYQYITADAIKPKAGRAELIAVLSGKTPSGNDD